MSGVDVLAVMERTQLRLRTDQSLSRRAKLSYADGLKDARAAVAELMEAHDELLRLAEQLGPFLPEIVKQRSKAALARCKNTTTPESN